MSKKTEKVAALLAGLPPSPRDARYTAYFLCFNRGEYYEAHDVLEHLWLEQPRGGTDHRFYQGLIQAAGAFVHMQHHHAAPAHPVHGRRLGPAARLLARAVDNTSHVGAGHHGLDLAFFHGLCRRHAQFLRSGANPWTPESAPRLPLPVDA
jgi:hypothetical protein